MGDLSPPYQPIFISYHSILRDPSTFKDTQLAVDDKSDDETQAKEEEYTTGRDNPGVDKESTRDESFTIEEAEITQMTNLK